MNELKTQFKAETKGYIIGNSSREECYSGVYVEWLEQQIKELKELLKVANCPNDCQDGSIAHGSNLGYSDQEVEWEQEQCQFCDERKQAIKK
jgi:hypothetical protein